MNPGDWQRIKGILEAVEEVEGPRRRALLDQLCAGEPHLRSEVDSLLAHEDRIAVFEPVVEQPRSIGPYRVERLLGSGGMGDVYLAARADDQFRKLVAIKVIQRFRSGGLERRFRTERQILATLEHPCIARLLDGGSLEDGRPYLVMEYVEGVPIDRWVDERRPPVPETLRLFLKVCAAVQFAHQNLVVHRDLKPGNILVDGAGEPRLLDFGIAKVLSEAPQEADSTAPFERMLTPSYASPEQVAGLPVTTATDVYSLGVLLNRLLHGSVPGDLQMVVQKAREKDPARRYGTVDAFAADVRRYMEGRPVHARRPSVAYRAAKFVRRNRFPVAAALVFALVVAAGAGGTVWYARRAQQRYEELRRLSESLLFEFHDSIANLPGATQARALLIQRSLQYLDGLAGENSSDPAVQRDLATAYARVGGILDGQRGPHLGGASALERAAASYGKALEIRRRLFLAGRSDAGRRKDYVEALGLVESVMLQQGRFDDALSLCKERLRTIEELPETVRPADLRYSYATTYALMSDIYRRRDDGERAVEASRRALQLREALLTADPQSVRAQRVVALSHEYVGYALTTQQRWLESAAEHQKALAAFQALLASDRRNVDLQRNLFAAEGNLCEALARAGQASAGEAHCRRYVEIAEEMKAADPQNVQGAEDTASAYATMGFALHQAGSLRKAREWEARAVVAYRDCVARDPDSADAQAGVKDASGELAKIDAELRKHE